MIMSKESNKGKLSLSPCTLWSLTLNPTQPKQQPKKPNQTKPQPTKPNKQAFTWLLDSAQSETLVYNWLKIDKVTIWGLPSFTPKAYILTSGSTPRHKHTTVFLHPLSESYTNVHLGTEAQKSGHTSSPEVTGLSFLHTGEGTGSS